MSKTYEEWLKYYENATKEQIIEDVEHDNLEIERLHSIIKEVREYIENGYLSDGEMVNILAQQELLEILDKES